MSSESPVVVLYDALGNPLATTAGTAPSSVLTIQGSSSGTAVPVTQSGTWTNTVTQTTAANLNATVIGTTSAGSGASSGLVTIQGNASGTPVPITGSITATNPSVSATAAAIPSDATFVGGQVQAVQSGLTAGDLYPLSLTTAGLLRVDGSNVTQPISGTITANAGTGTFTISGTVTSNAGTGNFTVVQSTASSLNATIVGLGTAGSPSGGVVSIQGVSGGQAIPVSGTFTTDKSSTSSLTSVAGATSSTQLLAANSSRISATFWNDSTSIAYIALSTSASATAYTIKMFPGAYWELPVCWTGAVFAIWVSANGNMRISELSP
jgi:peptidoglycan DL-endopeptidase CwlO